MTIRPRSRRELRHLLQALLFYLAIAAALTLASPSECRMDGDVPAYCAD